MAYEKEPFSLDQIPDYALQPARPAEKEEAFDPTIYERLLSNVERLRTPAPAPSDEDRLWQELMHLPAQEPLEEDQPQMEQIVAEEQGAKESELEVEQGFEPEAEPEAELESELGSDLEASNGGATVQSEPGTDSTVAVLKQKEAATRQTTESAAGKPLYSQLELLQSKLALAEINKGFQLQISIEEDILVPDTKPDLAQIIAMDGTAKLVTRDVTETKAGMPLLKLSGDFLLQTLYVPESGDQEQVISIESRLPFRGEAELRKRNGQELIVVPTVERVDYSVVNERKFRVRALVNFQIREYSQQEINLFEGVKDQQLQILKEKVQFTDVAARKRDLIDLREDLHIKDTMPEIQKLLKYDVRVVENHKQIGRDKAVINATVYCNIMYLGTDLEETYGKGEEGALAAAAGTSVAGKKPILFQGKTEFTHFLKLADNDHPESLVPAASKAYFDILSLNVTPKEDVNGHYTLFDLDLSIETSLEVYKNFEKEVVADVYHHQKEVSYDTKDVTLTRIAGSGLSELSVREIVNIPDRVGPLDSVAFVSGKILDSQKTVEGSKVLVDGTLEISLICVAADERKSAFPVKQQIPFKTAIDLPGLTREMQLDSELVVKDLWYDKINNRQVEAGGSITVKATALDQEHHQFIQNISFADLSAEELHAPSIVLYITRSGDNLWKVAKQYRTTVEEIQKINNLGQQTQISPGTRLLISRAN